MSTPTRRTVVRTGAWAIPAVTTLAAAPAFAHYSGQQCVTVTAVGAACKKKTREDRTSAARGSTTDGGSSSSNQYVVTLSFSACAAKCVTIVGWTMTSTAASSVSPRTVNLPSGTSTQTFTVTESGTPGTTLTVSYSVDGHTYTSSVDLGTVGTCP